MRYLSCTFKVVLRLSVKITAKKAHAWKEEKRTTYFQQNFVHRQVYDLSWTNISRDLAHPGASSARKLTPFWNSSVIIWSSGYVGAALAQPPREK